MMKHDVVVMVPISEYSQMRAIVDMRADPPSALRSEVALFLRGVASEVRRSGTLNKIKPEALAQFLEDQSDLFVNKVWDRPTVKTT